MKKLIVVFILILAVTGFVSCNNGRKEAIATVEAFLNAASSTNSANKPEKYYPEFDSYGIILKSSSVNIDEDVQSNGDTLIVKCVNGYTTDKGIFRQDSLTFFLRKQGNTDKYIIINSIGLLKLSPCMYDFACSLDIYVDNNTRDLKLSRLGIDLGCFYVDKFIDAETGLYRDSVDYTAEEFLEYRKYLNESLQNRSKAIAQLYPYINIIYNNKMKW